MSIARFIPALLVLLIISVIAIWAATQYGDRAPQAEAPSTGDRCLHVDANGICPRMQLLDSRGLRDA